ncbi:hypothetical protein P4I94_34445, partial [Bacillus cereus]|nr:hypothetical protein [Bacillus cereus]
MSKKVLKSYAIVHMIFGTLLLSWGFFAHPPKREINTKYSKLVVVNVLDYLDHLMLVKQLYVGVPPHAHQLKNLHYPQVSKNVILSKKLARKDDIFSDS